MKKTWILLTAIVLIVVGLILNFTIGNQFSSGDFCLNYFAAGDFACGVFAAGKFSCGIFSIGIFSIGVFSLGIFNIGLYVIGFFLVGWKKNYGHWLEKKIQNYNAQWKVAGANKDYFFIGVSFRVCFQAADLHDYLLIT